MLELNRAFTESDSAVKARLALSRVIGVAVQSQI